jgi:hypothetical protein
VLGGLRLHFKAPIYLSANILNCQHFLKHLFFKPPTFSKALIFLKLPTIFKTLIFLNPLPSGTLAAFFLTAVGPIQHTKEGDISREKTILMT